MLFPSPSEGGAIFSDFSIRPSNRVGPNPPRDKNMLSFIALDYYMSVVAVRGLNFV